MLVYAGERGHQPELGHEPADGWRVRSPGAQHDARGTTTTTTTTITTATTTTTNNNNDNDNDNTNNDNQITTSNNDSK